MTGGGAISPGLVGGPRGGGAVSGGVYMWPRCCCYFPSVRLLTTVMRPLGGVVFALPHFYEKVHMARFRLVLIEPLAHLLNPLKQYFFALHSSCQELFAFVNDPRTQGRKC